MKITIVLLVVGFLVGCGGGSGTTTPAAPTVHPLEAGDSRFPIGTGFIGPFTLPAGATVTYNIVDKPTGIGDDTMDFQVSTDAIVQAGSGTGYGVRTGVSSTGATTVALAADDYDLVVRCRNIVDDCFFSETITATY